MPHRSSPGCRVSDPRCPANPPVRAIYKKLSDAIAADVDLAVMAIAADAAIGTREKGDLADLYVCKFRSQNQLVLLGYTVDQATRVVYLEAVGAHENFYRNLKRAR